MKTAKLINEINRMAALEDLYMEKGNHEEYLKANKRKKELQIKLKARTQEKKTYKGVHEYYTPKLR